MRRWAWPGTIALVVVALGATGVARAQTTPISERLAGVLTGSATGIQERVSQPGATVFGDTIAQSSSPLARAGVEAFGSGALASVSYPGDLVGNAGSLAGSAGAPPVPNYPVVAKASYPASGEVGESAELGAPGVGTMRARAVEQEASASAVASEVAAGGSQQEPDAAPVTAQSLVTDVKAAPSDRAFTSRATSSGRGISIGGVIHIGRYESYAEARTDGTTGSGTARTITADVTVVDVPVVLDGRGAHVAGEDLPEAQRAVFENIITEALVSRGMSIRMAGSSAGADPVAPARGVASAGGIIVTIRSTADVTQELVFGVASASAAASDATGPAPLPGLEFSTPAAAGTILSAPDASAPSLSGGSSPAASPSPRTPSLVSSGPAGLILARRGMGDTVAAAALLAAMVMALALGYARWQLLDWLVTEAEPDRR